MNLNVELDKTVSIRPVEKYGYHLQFSLKLYILSVAMIAECAKLWLILVTATAETQRDWRFGGNYGLNVLYNFSKSNSSDNSLAGNDSYITPSPKLICFYTFTNEFDPAIMMDLCTHIIVGFFSIDDKTHCLDNSTEKLMALKQIATMKKNTKNLNILISVGGGGFRGFSAMVMKHSIRKVFIKSVINLLKEFKIDGIDLDWEWPALDGNSKEKIKFIQLLSEIRQEFDRHKKKYLLSVDVSFSKAVSELAYYVQYMAKYVDFANIMCYDYHYYTKWYPFTGHNAPLYSSSNESLLGFSNINNSIHYWISNSMPKEKIVLGIPTFGHSFRLSFSQRFNLNAPASGYGTIGESGFVKYSEVCLFIKNEKATVVFDDSSKVPYAYKFPDWVSYDNEVSLIHKVNYAERNNLSGIMIYSVNSDDFSGICNGDGIPLPLIRKIRTILFNEA